MAVMVVKVVVVNVVVLDGGDVRGGSNDCGGCDGASWLW